MEGLGGICQKRIHCMAWTQLWISFVNRFIPKQDLEYKCIRRNWLQDGKENVKGFSFLEICFVRLKECKETGFISKYTMVGWMNSFRPNSLCDGYVSVWFSYYRYCWIKSFWCILIVINIWFFYVQVIYCHFIELIQLIFFVALEDIILELFLSIVVFKINPKQIISLLYLQTHKLFQNCDQKLFLRKGKTTKR